MSDAQPGGEVAPMPFSSIEEVLSSIRLTARERNWTPQDVADTFNAGIAARAFLLPTPAIAPTQAARDPSEATHG